MYHSSYQGQQQHTIPMSMQQQQPLGPQQPVGPMHVQYSSMQQQQMMQGHSIPYPVSSQSYVQPTAGRLPADRPIVKLSVSLIETYKTINKVYYEERDSRRAARAVAQKMEASAETAADFGTGTHNNGWDDEHYDYIIKSGEIFNSRYIIRERIGKGSFGQVVRAVDTESNKDVAIKIIKSKRPFLMQAKTEVALLSHLCEKDPDDQHNIVRLITHFMYRNHQCLVFEMLSLNLYELLKNTQFRGVSLNLIRKFGKQILRALQFLGRKDVDIIHCDLKPENILLRHPKRSGVKVIDFGSSCESNKPMYSYIQSRFYRSPEVMLGLPYSVAIDMWSLGCILVEMYTGEPLFSGSDQVDQMQKIVKVLGMVPTHMLDQASDKSRSIFFERTGSMIPGEEWALKQQESSTADSKKSASSAQKQKEQTSVVVPSKNPAASLSEAILAETDRKKKTAPVEAGQASALFEMFVDLIQRMLAFDPKDRIRPEEALKHPFIVASDQTQPPAAASPSARMQQGSIGPPPGFG
uniref:Protein kinase domain-containing protein n=3 Tax=Attheya septentrionalis TaxID=420275 RepID=A0A7S2UJG5_9STRA|mmetsp:Transcript_28055/g.51093  ORF Transcript_28055/g.51093 Transcript_28055/m.51093 type:complete len:523 (+) Transcript_28055:1242-2810(+)